MIRTRREERLLRDVTDAMTTNESFFFRDIVPFEQLRKAVWPRLVEARAAKRCLRIWSAACSTGQEPYTIAMCVKEEAALLAGWRVEIVATDISREVLEKAKSGLYSQFEIQRGLPIQMLMKYFTKVDQMWQVKSLLRGMVRFHEHNLLDDPGSLGAFDVVFCRNLLIYFDQATKRQALERISRIMPADGFLFLGGTETVLGVTTKFGLLPELRGVFGLVLQTSH